MEELVLTSSEIDALIKWHIDQKYECANKEQYTDAENHRIRALTLQKTYNIVVCYEQHKV